MIPMPDLETTMQFGVWRDIAMGRVPQVPQGQVMIAIKIWQFARALMKGKAAVPTLVVGQPDPKEITI